MGALEDYDRFDPLFFNISPTEAESMDPQQRLFLQACWQSIEDAGYDARVLSGGKCGVFVGCATGQYQQLARAQQLNAHGLHGECDVDSGRAYLLLFEPARSRSGNRYGLLVIVGGAGASL